MKLSEEIIEALLEILNKTVFTEENVSHNFDGYSTPKAFGKRKKIAKNNGGYNIQVKENSLKESSYHDYKKDESLSNSAKINKSLIEINNRLSEIKKILDNNIKLKEEFNLTGKMWKLSPNRVNKVMEKLTYIGNKIKELTN